MLTHQDLILQVTYASVKGTIKKRGLLTHSLFQERVVTQTLCLVSGLCVHDVVC